GNTRLHLILVGDVHGDADGALAARVDLAGGGFSRPLIEVGNRNPRAFAREEEGDLLADAAGRAGDHGNLVRKAGPACDARSGRLGESLILQVHGFFLSVGAPRSTPG